MKQAKVLTVAERKRLLAVIANDRHSERNRLAVMLSYFAGLRVGEIASLSVANVVKPDGTAREELRLSERTSSIPPCSKSQSDSFSGVTPFFFATRTAMLYADARRRSAPKTSLITLVINGVPEVRRTL